MTGVFLDRDVLVADLGSAFVFQPDLPEEVPGEAGHPAARLDKAIDGVAHGTTPVFVMPDDDDAAMAGQQVRRVVNVMERRHVHLVAFRLEPARHVALVACPPGRRVLLGIAV